MKITRVLWCGIMSICFILFSSCTYKNRITGENISLDGYFGSNMVFQKGQPIVIKGKCSVNSVVGVRIEKVLKYAHSDVDGQWSVEFPPVDYNGTFNIFIEGKEEEIILDNVCTGRLWVVIGDGWLSDYYSNYEDTEEGTAINGSMRYFQPKISFTPGSKLKGEWKTQSRGGIKLNEKIINKIGEHLAEYYGERIGIVNLIWPGMKLGDLINHVEPHQDTLWESYFEAQKAYDELSSNSYKALKRNVLDRKLDDSGWMKTDLPIRIYKRRSFKNRVIWWRKRIYIPEKQAISDFKLNFDTIRGNFNFYFNGIEVANFSGETKHLDIIVPDTLIKKWSNLLTVRMVTGDSLSGFYSENISLRNADSSFNANISTDWKYRTYWEPPLPEVVRPERIGLPIVEDVFTQIDLRKITGLLVAGSSDFYGNENVQSYYLGFKKIADKFAANEQYIYLLPHPRLVDSIVNKDYYNRIRNEQLHVASQLNYKIINSINVGTHDFESMYNELCVELLEALDN